MTFIYTLNAPKLGSLNGFEIFLDLDVFSIIEETKMTRNQDCGIGI